MRKKIKELLHKEEGFTLVELLAVIVILGIIVAIAVPTIGNVIGNSQGEADAAEQELIIDAARLYYVSNPDEAPKTTGDTKEITVDQLTTAGFLESNASDADGKVTVTATDKSGLTYEYSE